MDADVKMKGIVCKTDKEDEDTYTVKFDVTLDDFDKAVKIAKKIEKNLANFINGQTVLR